MDVNLSKSFASFPVVVNPVEDLIICDGKSLFPNGEHDLNTYAYLNAASQIGYTVVILTSAELASEKLVEDVSKRAYDGAFDRFHFAFDSQVEGREAFVIISDNPAQHGAISKNMWQPDCSQIRKSLAFFGVVDEVDAHFAAKAEAERGDYDSGQNLG